MHSKQFCTWSMMAATALLLPLALCGCGQSGADSEMPATKQAERSVTVVKPERKTIRRAVGQPGLIQAFERTPIVARIPGYILEWNKDIGDPIQKGDILAKLWVPDMVSELKLKKARVKQAQKALAMAKAQVATARAQVEEAKAALTRAEANNNYWQSQSARFTKLVAERVLDKQTKEETNNQFQAAAAALTEAQTRVVSARAIYQEKESARDKAEADVSAAEADRQRQADLVGYATFKAPYDGVVTQRNVNTMQFFQPGKIAQGDVLYVVERPDIVRIFVSVPETDAAWVQVDAPATVRVQALQGEEFKGKVTRTAWSLNLKTRTMLTEIDLPNPELPKKGRRLRPGMYAYATIEAEWPHVLTLPASAVKTEGDVNIGYKSFCYLVENRRVKRTQIETGVRNDQLVEVLRKRAAEARSGAAPHWEAFSGTEEVVQSGLSGLKDGQAVEVKQAKK